MDESSSNGRLRAIGIVIGAAVTLVGGGYSIFQMRDAPAGSDSALVGRLHERVASIEASLAEVKQRLHAIETPGGPVPMSNATRERFESLDRVLLDIQRQIAANTARMDGMVERRK